MRSTAEMLDLESPKNPEIWTEERLEQLQCIGRCFNGLNQIELLYDLQTIGKLSFSEIRQKYNHSSSTATRLLKNLLGAKFVVKRGKNKKLSFYYPTPFSFLFTNFLHETMSPDFVDQLQLSLDSLKEEAENLQLKEKNN